MKTEQLIEEISDFLIVYLKAGKVGMNSFIKKAQLNLQQLEQLLQIHYLLKPDVQQFFRTLPASIRKFKTTTTATNERYIGEVRGQINWPNTMKERLRLNPKDRTIFSCQENIRNYDLPENVILKELIHTVYQILFVKIDTTALEKYPYFREWKELKVIVEEMMRHNVYLSKVNSTQCQVTDRMIQKTLGHRNPLYREAAQLLLLHRRVMNGDVNEDIIQELLKETFVYPEKEEVLFELYWVIQLIQNNSEDAVLHLIDSRRNLVASWEDDLHNYYIYHDSTGSKSLSFTITTAEVEQTYHPFIQKKVQSTKGARELAAAFFQSRIDTNTFWSGRPDILIEVYHKETKELSKVIIGEVKHTRNRDYAVRGLRELIDYMQLVKETDGVFLDEHANIEVEGILFVGDMEVNQHQVGGVRVVSVRDEDKCRLIITDNPKE